MTETGVIDFTCEEMGRMFSSSSITTHVLHDASESKKRSVNRPVASE